MNDDAVVDPGDLYPETDEDYQELLTWCLDAWLAGRTARDPFETKWHKYDKHYEAYINRKKGDWRSKVYMPEVFQQIETIKPRLVSQLRKFLVHPVGQEDVEGAHVMESLMSWAQKSSRLHLELVKVFHPTLVCGTGILKTFPDTQYAFGSEMVPVFQTETQILREPLIDPETQRQMIDLEGNPVFQEAEQPVQVPVGMRPQRTRYISYDGPAARAVNIYNFWPAPEAEDVQSARYVIHRTFKDYKEVKRLIAEGVYRWPEDMTLDDIWSVTDDPRLAALDELDMGGGRDATRKQVEILEFWVNDGPGSPGRVITLCNRKAILRVRENPFWHGQKPFIRFVDYLKPHHFWGIGEVQHMEGIADAINAITNQRIDSGRLDIDAGYVVNTQHLEDRRDLERRPGQVIRVRTEGLRPAEVIEPLKRGGVPEYAFREVSELQAMGERTTGVSSYQQGIDTPAQLDTATGAAIMQEAGSSRFGLKAKVFEIDPLENLAMHYGLLLQQFTTTERVMRIVGPDGAVHWEQIDPAALQGNFDFSVESVSAQQSETVKRQQALETFDRVSGAVQMGLLPPQAAQLAFKDVLEAIGAKSVLQMLEEMEAAPPQQGLPPEQRPLGEPPPEQFAPAPPDQGMPVQQ